jgi:hypothetical protein
MEKKAKKVKLDPVLIRDLRSGDDNTVLKALGLLRSSGNIGYIPELLDLLAGTDSEIIEKELVRFIADVKDTSIIPFILSGLKDPALEGIHGHIVSACWQSGLDYSRDLDLFIRLFLEGDYMTALEAFTVIEESAFNLETEALAKIRNQVLGGIHSVTEEKKPLARELVKLLEA